MELSKKTLEIISKWGAWYCACYPKDEESSRLMKDIEFVLNREEVTRET